MNTTRDVYEYSYRQSPQNKRNRHAGCIVLSIFTVVFILLLFVVLVVLIVGALQSIQPDTISSVSEKSPTPTPTTAPKEIVQKQQRNEAEKNLFKLHNNFEYFYNLTSAQERRLGVMSLPDDATRVTTIRGIGLYETDCRPFKEDEIALLTSFLQVLPREFLDTQPKGIVSSCLSQLGLKVNELTLGVASGPFLYLGDEFFIGRNSDQKLSKNQKLQTFMHEYCHILQYYYVHQYWIDQKVPAMIHLEDVSTLIYDFAPRVGWYQESKANTSPSFFELDDGKWILKDDPESQKITEYGKSTGPTEDFAESFALVVSGQPQTISQARRDYISSFLGTPEDSFVKGVVPQHPDSNHVLYTTQNYFSSELSFIVNSGKILQDTEHWSVDDSVGFSPLIDYYNHELANRDFTTDVPLTLNTGPIGKDLFAFGVYSYEDNTYAVILLGAKTVGTESQQFAGYSSTTYNQITIPDAYLVAVFRYE